MRPNNNNLLKVLISRDFFSSHSVDPVVSGLLVVSQDTAFLNLVFWKQNFQANRRLIGDEVR